MSEGLPTADADCAVSVDKSPQGGDVISSVVIDVGREMVRGHHHVPSPGRASRVPVLLCPPFGWEDMCSYRVRRRWAEALADAGHPVLRFDFPGTGDSTGSPHDPDLVGAWTETVERLAEELASAHGVTEVAAIGIGLGGAIALHAADLGAPIGQLALWGVPASGRRLVREMRAAAALIPPPDGAASVGSGDGSLELTGYLLTEATSEALIAVELSGGRTSAPRRMLLLRRDGIAVDPTFVERLRTAGAEVSLADGMGFGPMMADPEKSRIPEETMAATVAWLAADRAPAPLPPAAGAVAMGRGEPLAATARVAERAIVVPVPGGEVFGVLCVPADGQIRAPVAAVLLNGGAQRHTGQNRNWVETARRWAADGVPSVRIDLPGIGDAGGQPVGPLPEADIADLYDPIRTEQILATLSWLRAEEIAERFLLAGLCAGAYWAYHAGLADSSVAGLGLINLYTFAWSATLEDDAARRATVRALRGEVWSKLRSSERRRAAITRSLRTLGNVRALEHARRGQQEQTGRVGAALTELDARGCEVACLVGRDEHVREELHSFGVLERLPQWERVRVEEFEWQDHAVRALASQRLVAAWLDRLLARVLATGQPRPLNLAARANATDV